uniref:16S rRNA (cytidine(1402)-2'-O)-methyltransferase n=1 Tax=Ralstonia solanacearum TaxID=305 RepID=UPI00066E3ADB
MSDPDWTLLAHDQHYPAGALYVVATPIGNVADVSLRARHVLGLADAVACEDTRNTGQLLHRLGLSRPMLAAHEHNEREAAARIVERLARGERIAYVSDAGTPGVSDPGARIVEAVRAAGHRVIPLPGASAVVTALSAAGELLETSAGHFSVLGYQPPVEGRHEVIILKRGAQGLVWDLIEKRPQIQAPLGEMAEHPAMPGLKASRQ